MHAHTLRRRFWVEALVGIATLAVAILTTVWHDWAEALLGIDPDEGNGTFEVGVTVVLVAATVGLMFAGLEWRQARTHADI